MKTSDFTKTTSKQVNETIEKTFGKKINLESFTLDQLQDARNRLRTQLSQKRDNSRFDENIENDAYYQAQFMLDALNKEIAEREEFAVQAQEVNEAKAGYCSDECCGSDVKAEDCTCAPSCPHCDCNKTNESVDGEEMKDQQVTEGELQQASAIVTAKTMVDKVARYIEELSGMENETLIQLGDAIRDEIGDQQAKAFIENSAPAIQQAIETMKATRDSLGTATRVLAGEESPTDMLGAEPDAMNAEPEADMGAEAPETEPGEPEATGDDFAAAEPAAGGMETAGREQRESIDRETNLLRILAG